MKFDRRVKKAETSGETHRPILRNSLKKSTSHFLSNLEFQLNGNEVFSATSSVNCQMNIKFQFRPTR